jgi:hypothetical protein
MFRLSVRGLIFFPAANDSPKDLRDLPQYHQISASCLKVQVSLLSCPYARQLSLDVPSDAGFVCDRAAVLRGQYKVYSVDKDCIT